MNSWWSQKYHLVARNQRRELSLRKDAILRNFPLKRSFGSSLCRKNGSRTSRKWLIHISTISKKKFFVISLISLKSNWKKINRSNRKWTSKIIRQWEQICPRGAKNSLNQSATLPKGAQAKVAAKFFIGINKTKLRQLRSRTASRETPLERSLLKTQICNLRTLWFAPIKRSWSSLTSMRTCFWKSTRKRKRIDEVFRPFAGCRAVSPNLISSGTLSSTR